MHLNVYSDEGGIASYEAGKKKAKDGKVYPFVGIFFKNGNAIKFFGKTVEEIESVISKLNVAVQSLRLLQEAQEKIA